MRTQNITIAILIFANCLTTWGQVSIEYSADGFNDQGDPIFCTGRNHTFYAYYEGEASYIKWSHKGKNIPNMQDYVTNDLHDGDIISVNVSTENGSFRDEITVFVRQRIVLSPKLTSNAPAAGFCFGTAITFKADLSDQGTLPAIEYVWKRNGRVVSVNTERYTTSDLSDGDQIHVALQPMDICGTGSYFSSNILTMRINPQQSMVVTIIGPEQVCAWSEMQLKAEISIPKDQIKKTEWYVLNEKPCTNTSGDPYYFKPGPDFPAITQATIKCKITARENLCINSNISESELLVSINAPPALSIRNIESLCEQVAITADIPEGKKAYWQTTHEGTSFSHPGNASYIVSRPGVYYLRSYDLCWGSAAKAQINPEKFLSPPIFKTEQASDFLKPIVIDATIGYNNYYFQSTPTSYETDRPIGPITQAGTYYIRGKNDNNKWGCVSSPLVIEASDIPRNNNCDRKYIREHIIQQEGITDITQIISSNSIANYVYYDGLGRPMQRIAVGASPDKNDIITPIGYDRFGRQEKSHLPYEDKGNSGAYREEAFKQQETFYTRPNGSSSSLVPKDNHPYALTVYEPSALNRVVKQGSPGGDWHPHYGRSTRIWYNTNGWNEIRMWKPTGTGAAGTVFYPAGRLYRTDVVDENHHLTYQYTDLQGRVVQMSRKRKEGEMINTIYVFDNFDRPVYVLPDTVKVASFRETDIIFQQFIYAYQYDERGRVFRKHIPGAGWTYIVYNKQNLPVLTQDASQALRNEWSFTKYDAFGRVALTGLYTSKLNGKTLQKLTNKAAQWESRLSGENYTNEAFPGSEYTILTVNYYDNYSFTTPTYPDRSPKTKGLATGSKVKVLGSTPEEWLLTVLYYNDKGQMVHSKVNQPKVENTAVTDETTYSYDFTGRLLQSARKHSKGTAITLIIKNEYDHAGRLKLVKQHIGNGEITVAAHSYNELGQLTQTQLHQVNNTALQSIDYRYNIRGWLTDISSEQFRQKLHYNYSPFTETSWNGNISAIEWYTPGGGGNWHAYEFKYDPLDRLTAGVFKKSKMQGYGYGTVGAGHYNENYTYDIMGNITHLNRWLEENKIDELTCTYNGNQITRTTDTKTSVGFAGTSNYTYDAAGRMKSNSQKGITINYNHLHLPNLIQKNTSEKIEYTYDATGRRVKKKFGTAHTRYYIDGIEYEGSILKFISTPMGRIRKNAAGTWMYDYFLNDHLGNVRMVLTSESVSRQVYMASMEEDHAGEETLYFDNLDATRADRPYNYPDINPLNSKLAKVSGKSEGPKLTLKVMAGDTIEIRAQAFYNIDKTLPGQSPDIAPVLGSAIAAMTSGGAAALGEAAMLAADLGTVASTSVALVQVPDNGDNDNNDPTPQAGLNFVAYNTNFEVVAENTGILPVTDKINKIQHLSSDRIVIQENGFMEVFANNEAQTPVFFDNLMVSHSPGRLLEENHYYPYGLLIPGLSSSATVKDERNSYKYNRKELQEELELGWLDYGARMQNPAEGRWMVPDRFAEKYYHLSPYSYAAGNPINNIDVNGDSIWVHSGNNEKVLYSAGMDYNGNDAFVSRAVGILNDMSSVSSGQKLLGHLSSSKNSFNFINSLPSEKGTLSFRENSNGGGRILAGHLMSGTMSKLSELESIAHELFHGFQYESGQGGGSIYNEVEAMVYGFSVAETWSFNSPEFMGGASSGTPYGLNNSAGALYESAFNNLTKFFSTKDFATAVNNFKAGSQKNISGIYSKSNYSLRRSNQQKSLLRGFYPFNYIK